MRKEYYCFYAKSKRYPQIEDIIYLTEKRNLSVVALANLIESELFSATFRKSEVSISKCESFEMDEDEAIKIQNGSFFRCFERRLREEIRRERRKRFERVFGNFKFLFKKGDLG